MGPATKTPARSHRVMKLVRQRIEGGGERLWRFEDFRDMPFSAVAQARLAAHEMEPVNGSARAFITAVEKQPSEKEAQIRLRSCS
jgi:hypothetical protein